MHYTIGEISKLLGISIEGIRHYERKGVISSTRNPDNGYRYYGHLDITALIRSRSYRGFGFSIDETAELINSNDLNHISERYARQAESLDKERARLLEKQKMMEELSRIALLFPALEKSCHIVTRPAMYRLEYMHNSVLTLKKDKYPLLSSWVDTVPFAVVGMRCTLESLMEKRNDIHTGLNVMAKYKDLLELDVSDPVTYLAPCTCLLTYVREGGGFDSARCFAHVWPFLEERGLVPCGDSVARTLMSMDKSGSYTRLREVYLPVAPK